MNDMRIVPSPLSGIISAISSKSDLHRKLIASALSSGETLLRGTGAISADVAATISTLRAIGAEIEADGGALRVHGIVKPRIAALDCGESAATLRLMLPVVSAVCGGGEFSGSGRLPERPLDELIRVMERHGVSFTAGKLPLAIHGHLLPGEYQVSGAVSSQYISGLLLALGALDGASAVEVVGGLQSAGYVDMTIGVMARFGVNVRREGARLLLRGGYNSPGEVGVEADWSSAAFFLAAGAVGKGVTVAGLGGETAQGDRRILPILRAFGAEILERDGEVRVTPGAAQILEEDMGNTPDLVPVLAVLAGLAEGHSVFRRIERLRYKESDRVSAVCAMLAGFGVSAREEGGALVVEGRGRLSGGEIDGRGDHRIVMAAAIGATVAQGETLIRGAGAVKKSYPDFWADFRRMGGKAYVV